MIVQKTCKKCNNNLPIESFGNYKYSEDRHKNWCKLCTNKYQKNLINNNLDYKLKLYGLQLNYNKKTNYANQKKYAKSEKGKQALKRYQQTENGRIAVNNSSRKHRIKQMHIIHNWTLKEELNKLRNTNGICSLCDKCVGINKLTLDHILPISKVPVGAVYTINDIQFICRGCNSKKGNKTDIDYSSILKPKNLKKKLNYRLEAEILKFDKQLYSKVVDFIGGTNPTFTEEEILYLNNL